MNFINLCNAACVREYFNDDDTEEIEQDVNNTIYEGYKVVLDSKTDDENLVSFSISNVSLSFC